MFLRYSNSKFKLNVLPLHIIPPSRMFKLLEYVNENILLILNHLTKHHLFTKQHIKAPADFSYKISRRFCRTFIFDHSVLALALWHPTHH